MTKSAPPSSQYPWLVMLVGVPDSLLERCNAAASPIPTSRLDADGTVLEQIARLRPIVIVVGPDVDLELTEAIRARAMATRAELIDVWPTCDEGTLEIVMRNAIARAEARRAAARALANGHANEV